MSVSAAIEIKFEASVRPYIVKLVRCLLTFGWTFNYDGAVFYLPVGDDDDFDWQRSKISDEVLLNILGEKEKLGELVGVTMIWREAGVGGEFLFYTDGLISINLSVNRKKTEQDYTDVNWYFDKLVPAIRENNLCIESLGFSEHV